MNTDQMRYFVSVAKTMNFTKAAYENNVTQSTISKQVALLEKELGTQLFYRGNKSISLTPSGEAIYSKFILMLRELDSVFQIAKESKTNPYGHFAVGMFPFFHIKRTLPGLLKEFSVKYPSTNLHFLLSGKKELQRAFLNDDLDCAIMLPYDHELLESYDLKSFRLPNKPHRLIFPREMFPENYMPKLCDFKDSTFYFARSFEDQDYISNIPLDVLTETGFIPKNCIWLDSFDLALTYIEEGLGVCVVGPSTRIDSNKWVRSINLENSKSYISMTVYWKDTNPNPLLPLFIDILMKVAAK